MAVPVRVARTVTVVVIMDAIIMAGGGESCLPFGSFSSVCVCGGYLLVSREEGEKRKRNPNLGAAEIIRKQRTGQGDRW
ncbi:hypothetical protein QBC42DRAFT_269537 [Cladorrhinum samala]|uniref:Secreted protein n=1 Tax=Cladorrhinum samala TaxID=585594 RepID=A0AAV9HQL4_9PEZI|nr:hypothetical protein QBC42DRAFT_269537 [Cladorrhinum samala]